MNFSGVKYIPENHEMWLKLYQVEKDSALVQLVEQTSLNIKAMNKRICNAITNFKENE